MKCSRSSKISPKAIPPLTHTKPIYEDCLKEMICLETLAASPSVSFSWFEAFTRTTSRSSLTSDMITRSLRPRIWIPSQPGARTWTKTRSAMNSSPFMTNERTPSASLLNQPVPPLPTLQRIPLTPMPLLGNTSVSWMSVVSMAIGGNLKTRSVSIVEAILTVSS